MDYTISSTGFVNYFPSSERTQRAVENACAKYGEDIAIIDGEDDWNVSSVFHIDYWLEKMKITSLGSFHTGISGITTSGAVIRKSDLETFISKFNRMKWKAFRNNRGRSHYGSNSIRIYDPETKMWRTFFELQYKDNIITDLYKRTTRRKEVHCIVNNFKLKKNTYMWPL